MNTTCKIWIEIERESGSYHCSFQLRVVGRGKSVHGHLSKKTEMENGNGFDRTQGENVGNRKRKLNKQTGVLHEARLRNGFRKRNDLVQNHKK